MKKRKAEAAPSSSPAENLSEGEEEQQANGVSDYEQERIARIRENRARLEALGLPALASSLLASSSKNQKSKKELGPAHNNGKKKKKTNEDDDDDEYLPSDDDDGRGHSDDGESSSDSEEEAEEEDVGPSSSSRTKGKKKGMSNAGVKKSSSVKRNREDTNQIDDDAALQHAIALSLDGTVADSTVVSNGISPSSDRTEAGASLRAKKDKSKMQEPAGRMKNRKMNKSRVQLTEDEVVAYFFSFDEAGKGHISLRDLQRMVLAHDFDWTELEVASMIHSFDTDRDGKLSLEDFRTIVSRCNMIQEIGKD